MREEVSLWRPQRRCVTTKGEQWIVLDVLDEPIADPANTSYASHRSFSRKLMVHLSKTAHAPILEICITKKTNFDVVCMPHLTRTLAFLIFAFFSPWRWAMQGGRQGVGLTPDTSEPNRMHACRRPPTASARIGSRAWLTKRSMVCLRLNVSL